MSLIGTGVFFLWPFCKLGFSHPGKGSGDSSHMGIGYSFCAVLVWNPGGTPCNGLYTEAPPERGRFFRLQERYVRKFKLQAPTTWNKGLTRFRQSPHFSFRPNKTSSGSRPSDKVGGDGHPDSEIKGGPVSKKIFPRPFGPLFGLKLRGDRAPPLSPRYVTEDNRRLCSPTKSVEKNVSKPLVSFFCM